MDTCKRVAAVAFLSVFLCLGAMLPACEEGDDGGGGGGDGDSCETSLDASKVKCVYGTVSSGGSIVGGSAGATDPGAAVTVTYGDETWETTAGEDGSFAKPILVPRNATVKVCVKLEGCTEKCIDVVCELPPE